MKKIWIRFENMEVYEKQEAKLKELLRTMPGECRVIIFLDRESKKRTLCEKIDDQQIGLLEDAFGKKNIVCMDEGEEKPVRHIIPGIVQIIPCNHDMYAVFSEDGEELGYKVLMYALCDDGRVYPLIFDKEFGISSVEDAAFYAKRFELEGGEITLQEGKPE